MIQEGIHNISNEDYHADPCPEPSLSRGIINTLLTKSPAHAWVKHPRLNPDCMEDDGGGKFDIGSASHSLLLEGVDNAEIIIADDWRTKAAKEARKTARVQGKTPLLEKEYDKTIVMVERAIESIKIFPEFQITDLQKDGDSELTVIWSEVDDIGRKSWHRVRPDWWSKDRKIIIDYKTTGISANPNDFGKHIFNMGYDIQESYYSRGAKAVSGIEPKFIFFVQEITEPFLCSFIGLSPMFQDIGKQKTDYGIFMWNECIQNQVWPGYPTRICWADPPGWALTSWEQRASEIGL